MNNSICNMNVYLNRMQKSVMDKLFFIDKVFEPFENIVDFGCANGELLKAIQTLFGDEYRYYGYDISADMIQLAKVNVPQAIFASDWDELKIDPSKSLLNISSTIHEVYSYCDESDIDVFWTRVFDSGFRYITIRDMMVSESTSGPADEEDIKRVYAEERYAKHLRDYESVWGKIKSEKDLVHYLLKYSYTENWEREVRENYIALTLEEFKDHIPENYQVTFSDHFTLPYIAWQIKKDFNIELNIPTHVKVILKKK